MSIANYIAQMNLFQYITLPLVLLLLVRSLHRLYRGAQPRRLVLMGVVLWSASGIAILNPTLTMAIARLMGIGRGADLLLYATALSFLLLVGYLHNKLHRMETDITRLVRQIAIQNPVHVPTQTDRPSPRSTPGAA